MGAREESLGKYLRVTAISMEVKAFVTEMLESEAGERRLPVLCCQLWVHMCTDSYGYMLRRENNFRDLRNCAGSGGSSSRTRKQSGEQGGDDGQRKRSRSEVREQDFL